MMMPPDPALNALERSLGAFDEATSALLKARLLLRRTDTKFILSLEVLEAILPELRPHYALLLAGGQTIATYETLYYDTEALDFFHDHRRGRRVRQKVRLRSYPEREVAFLEVKQKTGPNRTAKQRLKVPFGQAGATLEQLRFARPHVRPNAPLTPRVWTNFRRITLLGVDQEERVTIDLGLQVSSADHAHAHVFEQLVIVELKQPHFTRDSVLSRALSAHGVRSVSASKYCSGVIVTTPHLRYNRLQPALRRIQRIAHVHP